MTSAEPVDMTAIRIKKSMAYSPVLPRSFCATRGATRPEDDTRGFLILKVTCLKHVVCVFTSADVGVCQEWRSLSAAEADVGQSHGGGEGERDGEPREAAEDEAPNALQRFGSHRALPKK